MSEIERLIIQAVGWRDEHRTAHRQIEACAVAIRAHALLDAYRAIGGNTLRWRKECGVLR